MRERIFVIKFWDSLCASQLGYSFLQLVDCLQFSGFLLFSLAN